MTDNTPNPDKPIKTVLGIGLSEHHYRRIAWISIGVVLLLVLAGLFFSPGGTQDTRIQYEMAEVTQGDMTVTVTATGTVQPVNQVDVGSELSGTIQSVLVDFNDQVKQGQVLARLDTERLHAQVIEARATLESAKAKHQEAGASVIESKLRFQRCEKLAQRQLCSQEELDTLRADQGRAKAAEASARAQIAVAEAALKANMTNMSKAEIRSPIDGLVLRRQIEPGQTVAASLQAPVLFTLAEDLTQMELHVAVDEADVGKINIGQAALFTVDAYPDRKFPATITQVRFAPQTVEGVVTYETVLSVDNSDLSLRPGMTATAVITVQELKNILLLHNAALRFTPPVTKKVESSGGIFGALFRRPHSSRQRNATNGLNEQNVWLLQDDQPVSVAVKTGASDGKNTELKPGEISTGQKVIVDTTSIKP